MSENNKSSEISEDEWRVNASNWNRTLNRQSEVRAGIELVFSVELHL